MKGFVVFELAPPFRWTPHAEKVGPVKRIIWLWFSFILVTGWKWTDFNKRLITEPILDDQTDKTDEWFVG